MPPAHKEPRGKKGISVISACYQNDAAIKPIVKIGAGDPVIRIPLFVREVLLYQLSLKQVFILAFGPSELILMVVVVVDAICMPYISFGNPRKE